MELNTHRDAFWVWDGPGVERAMFVPDVEGGKYDPETKYFEFIGTAVLWDGAGKTYSYRCRFYGHLLKPTSELLEAIKKWNIDESFPYGLTYPEE